MSYGTENSKEFMYDEKLEELLDDVTNENLHENAWEEEEYEDDDYEYEDDGLIWDTEEPYDMSEAEHIVNLLGENYNVVTQQDDEEILVNLKQYFSRGVDKELFQRMVYLSWGINNNREVPYVKDDSGSLIAPIHFWVQIHQLVLIQMEADEDNTVGFKIGG